MLFFVWKWELGFIHFAWASFGLPVPQLSIFSDTNDSQGGVDSTLAAPNLLTLAWHISVGQPQQLDVTTWTLSLRRRTSVRAKLTLLAYAFTLWSNNSSNFPLLHQSNPLEEALVRAQSARLSANVPSVFLNACLPQNHFASLIDAPINSFVLLPRGLF